MQMLKNKCVHADIVERRKKLSTPARPELEK